MGTSWKKTLYSVCIAQFIAMVGFGFVFPFMAFYLHDLGVPAGPQADKWAGILVTAMGVPMAICSPIWGWVADRHGRKNMVLRAMFGGAVTVALMAFVQNVHQLFVLRILQGILTGTITASMAMVASATPPEHSGYALGLVTVSASGGNFMGPLLGGYAAKFVGYRPTFLIAGVILVIGGFIVTYGTEENFERHATSRVGMTRAFLPLLAIGSFLVPLLTLCLITFAATAPTPIFPYFVQHVSAMDDKDAAALTGIIISVVGIVETLSAWIFGRWGDRWGHRQVLMAAVVWGGIMAGLQAYARNVPQTHDVPHPVRVRHGRGFPHRERHHPQGGARAQPGQGVRPCRFAERPGMGVRPARRRVPVRIHAGLSAHVHVLRNRAVHRLAVHRVARQGAARARRERPGRRTGRRAVSGLMGGIIGYRTL